MNTELNSIRLPVYEALNELPSPIFAALCYAMTGVNRVIGLTVVDDPTSCYKLERAMKPFLERLEE